MKIQESSIDWRLRINEKSDGRRFDIVKDRKQKLSGEGWRIDRKIAFTSIKDVIEWKWFIWIIYRKIETRKVKCKWTKIVLCTTNLFVVGFSSLHHHQHNLRSIIPIRQIWLILFWSLCIKAVSNQFKKN